MHDTRHMTNDTREKRSKLSLSCTFIFDLVAFLVCNVCYVSMEILWSAAFYLTRFPPALSAILVPSVGTASHENHRHFGNGENNSLASLRFCVFPARAASRTKRSRPLSGNMAGGIRELAIKMSPPHPSN